jgi:hypothetical protein
MTSRHRYTFYLDDDQRAQLAAIKARDGVSESEQIRRAVKAWLAEKGVAVTTPPTRRPMRKKKPKA